MRARALTDVPSRMNGTETAYAALLEVRRRAGEVYSWRFEAVNLRLAGSTYYRPDFMVVLASGLVEWHEVKGFWREDARAKIKVAAEMYPEFRFVAAQKDGRGWKYETLPPHHLTRT